jgi:hypothetical protein
MEAESRLDRHEHKSLGLPSPVHGVHEFRIGLLGWKRQREAARDEDLPDQRDRTEVRASEDHALAQAVCAEEVIPSFDPNDLVEARTIKPRDMEHLEVLTDLVHEHASGGERAPRRDYRQIRAHGGPPARRHEVRDRPGDL